MKNSPRISSLIGIRLQAEMALCYCLQRIWKMTCGHRSLISCMPVRKPKEKEKERSNTERERKRRRKKRYREKKRRRREMNPQDMECVTKLQSIMEIKARWNNGHELDVNALHQNKSITSNVNTTKLV